MEINKGGKKHAHQKDNIKTLVILCNFECEHLRYIEEGSGYDDAYFS